MYNELRSSPQETLYLEIPLSTSSPVKLSSILQKRLEEFMKARLEKIQEQES